MPYTGYTIFGLICIALVLLVWKDKTKLYPYSLYLAGLAMLLLVSCAGFHLVGSDVHLEYYYASLSRGYDVLQPLIGIPQATSIAPSIAAYLPWPVDFTFKVIYPAIFATVPVFLYFIFKTILEPRKALLAAATFIIFPTFFMELPGLARQMTAEVALAGALYLLLVRKSRWSLAPPVLVPLLHYSVAMLSLPLLLPMLLIKELRKKVACMLAIIVVVSLVYFPLADEGAVMNKFVHIYNLWVPEALEIHTDVVIKTLPPAIDIPVEPTQQVVAPATMDVPFLNKYERLVQDGLGLDFPYTTAAGKAFRIIQWLFLPLAAVGAWRLRKVKWMYGGYLLILIMLVPGVSGLLNATRFLHVALIVLAPALVVALRPRYLLPLLLVYFAFTSGVVFEATHQQDVQNVTIPYNVGLSNYRIDLGASTTPDDLIVQRYIYDHELFPLLSDVYGSDLVGEVVGWRDDLHISLFRDVYQAHGCYVFARSRNVWDDAFTVWNGVGCRKTISPADYGIDLDKNIIFQSGDARVIWVP